MRKPRDIDAELKALAERTRSLKVKRTTQLGELVAITCADALDLETLAGALLAAASGAPDVREAWRRDGAAFFRERGRARRGTAAEGGRARPAARDGEGAPG